MNWDQVKAIFSETLPLSPAERAARLEALCGSDQLLRAEVERLLAANAEAETFLEKPFLDMIEGNPTEQTTTGFSNPSIGPYKILRELGRGGMGVVYLADRADGEFHKKVAIKLLHNRGDEQLIARFRLERQILADLEHPNIARLLDGGTIDGTPYVVMEYIEGQSLRATLKERGALPLDQIVSITTQICAGLEAAHSRGIVHRDIKPENILVTIRDGDIQVKLLDFGIARSQSVEGEEHRTQTGVVIGTAAYMSPEQAMGATHDQIDKRSDVYSAGMVLFEMLTGEVAFKGASALSILNKQIHQQPAAPGRLRSKDRIPASVERVVLKALSKSRETRQQSARELGDEFAAAFAKKQFLFPDLPWRLAGMTAMTIILLLVIAGSIRRVYKMRGSIGQSPATAQAISETTPRGLKYRIFRQRKDGDPRPLSAGDFLQDGDIMHIEVAMPFEGTFYLYQKIRDGSLVWANPLPDGSGQRGNAGSELKVPQGRGIPMGPTPGVQTYLAVYIPWTSSGPTADVSWLPFAYREGESNVYFMRIPREAAAKTLSFLRSSAAEIKDFFPQPEGVFTHPPSPNLSRDKVLFHEIVIEQR